jgi:hypothetical protein
LPRYFARDAAEIIDDYVQAEGGAKALAQIRTEIIVAI